MKRLITLFCLLMLGSSLSHAAVTINVTESGGDVVSSASGTLNTTSLGNPGSSSFNGGYFVGDNGNVLITGPKGLGFLDTFSIGSDTTVFGTGPFAPASSSNGVAVGVSSINGAEVLYVPDGYVSGTSISSSSTWAGTTFAGLGMTPGQYIFRWGYGDSADLLTLNIGPQPQCVMYNDRASFEVAAPGLPTEDFEATTAGSFPGPLDENTNAPPFVVPGNILAGVVFTAENFASGNLELFDSTNFNVVPDGVALTNSSDTDNLVITFSPAVSAFGMNMSSENESISVRIYNTGEAVLLGSYDGVAPHTGGFLGCTSTEPVERVVVSAPANASGNYEAIDNISFGEPSVAPITYSIEGTVSGLTALGLVLQNNAGDDLDIFTNGPFLFNTRLDDGSAYAVTVLTHPPGQTCNVTNGSGTISGADVTDVIVSCADDQVATYTVGGTVSGLTGTGLALQNNAADTLPVATNGLFTFVTALVDGSAYAVTVSTQPTGQTCTVTNGSGTIATANVTDVAVTCVDDVVPTYTVGGTVSGLTGSGLALQNNAADTLPVATNGVFTFVTALVDGSAYAVTVSTQPTGQTCTVTNGSGTIATANVTDVVVTCEDDVTAPPPPPPVPMEPIPTLSEWALALLIMLVGLMVFASRRRLF